MRVLITGGAGFIGFHLADAHARDGDDVTLMDSLAKTDGHSDSDLRRVLADKRVRLLRIDLTAPGASLNHLELFDVVYHLAAINGTSLFYEIPYELARANVLMTINLLDALARRPPKRLVYTSSSEVYADADKLGILRVPTDESAPVVFTQPTSVRFSYGSSKFIGEFLCLRFGERYGVATSVIRYHNVYGPRMGHRHVVPELSARIRAGEDPLVVHGMEETRAFCYVDDAVRATRMVGALRMPVEVVHVGDPREEVQIGELAQRLVNLLGRQVKIVPGARRPGSVRRRCPDISLLRRLTGFSPTTSLDDGLKRTVHWYEAHPRTTAPAGRPSS